MSALQQFRDYDFNQDTQFQQGLSAILAGQPASDDAELKAQLFYFNRITGHTLTVEEIQQQPKEEPVLTLAQLTELLQSGKTEGIPNNKVISGELSPDKPSESTAKARKKPWES